MFRRKLRWLLGTCMLLALGLTVGAQQNQPPYQAQAPVPSGSQEHYAPNLGIYYEFIPYSPYGGGGYNPSSPPLTVTIFGDANIYIQRGKRRPTGFGANSRGSGAC